MLRGLLVLCLIPALGSDALAQDANNNGEQRKGNKAEAAVAKRVVLEGVDRYRVVEPLFEGVRVILSYRGEKYSPAYVQGISGAAFRIAGPCPCAPTCETAMWPDDLIRMFGYECEQVSAEEKDEAERKTHWQQIFARVKAEIRGGRPVLMWNAVTSCEFDVVCGFDEEKHELYGRGSYASYADREDYVTANELNPLGSTEACDGPHVIFIGDRTGEFDARAAEIAALKEAVAHARGGSQSWLAAGLECYDLWIATYRKKSPFLTNLPTDSYPLDILPSTRLAASQFMRELAPKYPKAQAHLEMAAEHFAQESEALKACQKVLADRKEELPEGQRIRAAGYLSQARAMYALGIAEIERALRYIEDKQD